MAHAFLIAGDIESGREAARAYAVKEFGLEAGNPDLVELSYSQLPVEETRRIGDVASRMPVGSAEKVVIISVERFFHEAQNACLKIFEEPPAHTVLILVIGSAGLLLPTLRSRLTPLRREESEREMHPFVHATPAERAKLVEKILTRSRSNNDEEKQAARADALRLVEDLTIAAYAEEKRDVLLLDELSRLTPILHERSAPLKMILEHLLITVPKI